MSSIQVKDDLKRIPKVGEKAAEALFKAGFTLEKVAEAIPDDIKEVLRCSITSAKIVVANAKKVLGAAVKPPLLASEFEKEREETLVWYKTGSKNFDELLGGGFISASTAGIGGHQSTGKTQLGFEMLLYTQNVLEGYVVFVETELNTYSPRRLRQMAAGHGWEYDADKVILVPSQRIVDVGSQYYQYQRTRDIVQAQGYPVKLIIVDSLTALFRRKFVGRDMLPNRSAELGRHLTFLEDMAKQWNALAYVTCQVIECPVSPQEAKGGFSSADSWAQFRTPYIVWGGHILRHTLGTWMMVTKKSRDVWKVTLFDSSELESGEVLFKITEKGIEDYAEPTLI